MEMNFFDRQMDPSEYSPDANWNEVEQLSAAVHWNSLTAEHLWLRKIVPIIISLIHIQAIEIAANLIYSARKMQNRRKWLHVRSNAPKPK